MHEAEDGLVGDAGGQLLLLGASACNQQPQIRQLADEGVDYAIQRVSQCRGVVLCSGAATSQKYTAPAALAASTDNRRAERVLMNASIELSRRFSDLSFTATGRLMKVKIPPSVEPRLTWACKGDAARLLRLPQEP